jgi:hypothetical protein
MRSRVLTVAEEERPGATVDDRRQQGRHVVARLDREGFGEEG